MDENMNGDAAADLEDRIEDLPASGDLDEEAPHKPVPSIAISLTLAAGVKAHQAGRLERAVRIYQDILSRHPDHADANYLLGVAAFDRGLFDDARLMVERAAEVDPNNAAYQNRLGDIYARLGREGDAERAYSEAMRLDPESARPRIEMGLLYERERKFEKAEGCFRAVIEAKPNYAEAYWRLASVLIRKGLKDQAIESLRQAIALNGKQAEAHHLLGHLLRKRAEQQQAIHHLRLASDLAVNAGATYFRKIGAALAELGDPEGAVAALKRALNVDPDNTAIYLEIGDSLCAKKDYEAAAMNFRRALEINPNLAAAHARSGNVMIKLGRFDIAVDHCAKAVKLAPKDANVIASYGEVLRALERLEDAVVAYSQAAAMAPENVAVLKGYAISLLAARRSSEALLVLDQCLALVADNAEINTLYGMALLQNRQWAKGWKAFQSYSRQTTYSTPLAKPTLAKWHGSDPLDLKIAVAVDFPYGEAIQFARFCPDLSARGGEVVMVTKDRQLAPLFENLPGVRSIVGDEISAKAHGCTHYTSLSALPYSLDIASERALRGDQPYLFADPVRASVWRSHARDVAGSKLKVGIVWQGRKDTPGDQWRSPGIWPFSRLFYLGDMSFFSLQTGDGLEALDDPQLAKVVDNMGREFNDFADTAAAIDAMDVIVCPDTAVAHLAGALGKTVFIVLPYAANWRWMVDKERVPLSTPWYHSAKLFHQSRPGDWGDAFAHIADELTTLQERNTLIV